MNKRIFICESCEGSPELETTEEVYVHLRDVHSHTSRRGKRRGISFLDGAKGWYRNTFQWTFGKTTILEINEGGG